MRTVWTIVLILATPIWAEGGEFVLTTKVPRVPSQEILRERCEKRSACTRFVSERLSVQCTANPSGWGMKADATSVALLYYLDSAYVTHESLHIGDMRTDVTKHLRTLEAQTYAAQDSCESAAKKATAEFTQTMKRFARESIATRH